MSSHVVFTLNSHFTPSFISMTLFFRVAFFLSVNRYILDSLSTIIPQTSLISFNISQPLEPKSVLTFFLPACGYELFLLLLAKTTLLSQTNSLTSSEETTRCFCKPVWTQGLDFAKHPTTLTVSMLAVFSIKTRAEGKQLSGRSQRFWPEI